MGGRATTTTTMAGAVLAWAFFFGAPAAAQDWPMPKVYKGMQGQAKGQWQMEVLEGGSGRMPKMTMCTDNLMKQADANKGAGKSQAKSDCKHRLLKDTNDEAIIESTCGERVTTIDVKREDARTLIMTMDSKTPKGPQHMKMRYTHLGPCREGQPTMTLDKDSEQCQKIRAQAAKMDPAKQCANQQGSGRQECESRVRDAVAQMSSMCN